MSQQRYETTGTIKRIGATEVKSEKFSKRSFTLEIEDGKYPQICEFQVTGERCGQLDEFQTGDEVKIAWNLRGREWTGRDGVTKTFNSLDVWRLERIGAARPASAPTQDVDQSDIPF
jgi:hypothetical protein